MSVTVQNVLEAGQRSLGLKLVCGEKHLRQVIPEPALNRPGLALAGFFRHFAYKRIQVLGLAEMAYLDSLGAEDRRRRLGEFFSQRIPCAVITRHRRVPPDFRMLAESHHVPVLQSPMVTVRFMNEGTILVENLAAPQARVQGTMVDILGIGVLLQGEAGIGKSEVALALIESGHSLVADDVTVLRADSSGVIIGSPAEITRYHMEIRGLGIIHVPSLFGVASVRDEMRLDLVVQLHRPAHPSEDDRSGLAPQSCVILGQSIPMISVPVMAGRDLAHVIEVAALNQKLKRLGHDAAKELDQKLLGILSQQQR